MIKNNKLVAYHHQNIISQKNVKHRLFKFICRFRIGNSDYEFDCSHVCGAAPIDGVYLHQAHFGAPCNLSCVGGNSRHNAAHFAHVCELRLVLCRFRANLRAFLFGFSPKFTTTPPSTVNTHPPITPQQPGPIGTLNLVPIDAKCSLSTVRYHTIHLFCLFECWVFIFCFAVVSLGATNSTLQELKTNKSSGVFTYEESDDFHSVSSNRHIVWYVPFPSYLPAFAYLPHFHRRTCDDILELSEHSLNKNLIDFVLKIQFKNTLILPNGVSIHETPDRIYVLVTTLVSAHRFAFDHPNKLVITDCETIGIFINCPLTDSLPTQRESLRRYPT